MNSYLAWNNALGEYFFHPDRAGQQVTLYIDRRRIEEIGLRHGLGGWQDFLKAAGTRVPTTYHNQRFGPPHPLRIADDLRMMWDARQGSIGSQAVDQLAFPPILVGLALLVLAWTEGDAVGKRSYYQGLTHFLHLHFRDLDPDADTLNQATAKRLIEELQPLQRWLRIRHGQRRGALLLGQSSHHRWVGAIKFHAYLDQGERESLPMLWTTLGLERGQAIAAKRLADLVLQVDHIDQHMPLLCKSLKCAQIEQVAIVADLLHAEFLTWDGQAQALPIAQPKRTKPPRLRIAHEDSGLLLVMVEWAGELAPLTMDGITYRVQRHTDSPLSLLVYGPTGTPVEVDATWLFGEIVLQNAQTTIRRARRQHIWLWPSSSLGYARSGHLESSRFLEDAAFQLFASEEAIGTADAWWHTTHACHGRKRIDFGRGIFLYRGAYPKWNPFQPPKILPPKPTLKLAAKHRIGDGVYRAEFPLHLEIVGGEMSAHTISAEPLLTQKAALNILPADHGYEISLPGPFALGSYNILLRGAQGEITDNAVVQFLGTEPLRHEPSSARIGFNHRGAWTEGGQTTDMALFLHNRFWGTPPTTPELNGQTLLTTASSALPDRPWPDLCSLLIAAARRDGSLSIEAFKDLVQRHAAQLGLPPLAAPDLHELRRTMSTLGFFHYDYRGRQLQLSPMNICLLPDDHLELRALLLGTVPQAVVQFLQEWSARGNRGLQLQWCTFPAPLTPPVIEIRCMQMASLEALNEALLQHFPQAVGPLLRQSLSESLLAWLDDIPAVPRMLPGGRKDWTSFPAHEDRWDVHACAFVKTDAPPSFPVLTRVIERHIGLWHCRWWTAADHGFDVSHFAAIPYLYQQAGLPYIGQNAARTDEIVLAGRHRQAELLERALVMATGQLPTRITASQIPQWGHLFEPDAPFRRFEGLRPPMRRQLQRIFQHVLHLDPSHPFPQIHID